MKRPMIDYMQKDKFDNLFTPEYAIEAFMEFVPPNWKIWECCDPGNSNISKILRNYGHEVICTDVTTGHDFLLDNPVSNTDMVITNPPYSLKTKFLRRCYDLNVSFAMLLPLTTLEGVERGEMFRKYGINVLVLDKRVDFTGKGRNWYSVAWFYWWGRFYSSDRYLNFKKLIKI